MDWVNLKPNPNPILQFRIRLRFFQPKKIVSFRFHFGFYLDPKQLDLIRLGWSENFDWLKFNFFYWSRSWFFHIVHISASGSPEGSTVDLTIERTISTSTDATPTSKCILLLPVHQHFILNNETQKMQCKHCRWVSNFFNIGN